MNYNSIRDFFIYRIFLRGFIYKRIKAVFESYKELSPNEILISWKDIFPDKKIIYPNQKYLLLVISKLCKNEILKKANLKLSYFSDQERINELDIPYIYLPILKQMRFK